jgi:hypothetical protein
MGETAMKGHDFRMSRDQGRARHNRKWLEACADRATLARRSAAKMGLCARGKSN